MFKAEEDKAMLYSGEQKILTELHLPQRLLPLLRSVNKLEKGDIEAVREDMLIVKKFLEWHELPSNKHKYSKLVDPVNTLDLLAIKHWWNRYCELRKTIAKPTYEDIHNSFLKIYGPLLKKD